MGTFFRRTVAVLISSGIRSPRAVVVGWLLMAAVLTIFVTPLTTVVARSSAAFLPEGSSTLSGLRSMDAAFGSGRTSSYLFVVMESANKLDAADRNVLSQLVTRLRSEPARISELDDSLGGKKASDALTSDDGKSTYFPVGISSPVGSPTADADVKWIRSVVASLDVPPGTKVFVTGDPAMISDLTTAVNEASHKVTAVTVVLLLVILWLVYRRWITVFVPLATIGVALLCARGALALAGQHGVSLSTYTDAFVIAITLGAGTDYCVFLISRFREEYANGRSPADAISIATERVGPPLLASAATVILGAISLSFADLAIFATTGPAMTICVMVTVAVSLTFTPALVRWLGVRIGPAPATKPTSRWRGLADRLVRRPGAVLLASTAALLMLAAFAPTMKLSFDERAGQPQNTPSNLGLSAMNRHFPSNEILPDYLLITSDRDMRNTSDLAVLNAVSVAIGKVPEVEVVRSITQPLGTPLKPASIANQLGEIARRLNSAGSQLKEGQPGLRDLARGADKLDTALSKIAGGSGQAAAGTQQLADGSKTLTGGIDRAGRGVEQTSSGSQRLASGAEQLANGLTETHQQVSAAVDGLDAIVRALNRDLLCSADPVCARARRGLETIALGQRNQLLPGLAEAAQGARSLQRGNGDLASALRSIADGLDKAEEGSREIARGQSLLAAKLGELTDGTTRAADGAQEIGPGVERLLTETVRLQQGLTQTSDYLEQVNTKADSPISGGFYLPARALNDQSFAQASNVFLSADGHTARIQVTGKTDPLTRSGQARYAAIQAAARQALNDTPLQSSNVAATGAGGLGADLKHYLFKDAKLVVSVVLLVVLLILIITLRALVAPLYLLASVVLSCAAALGLTTLLFQHILGKEISFTVPVMVFVLLVSVGADYNILLMSRMRESVLRLTRADVGEAVIATGPVITAAGVIFAATFVALLTSPILALTEIGFAVSAGLLLDTFVVRSMVVPACAAILEDRNWWPGARLAGAGNSAAGHEGNFDGGGSRS